MVIVTETGNIGEKKARGAKSGERDNLIWGPVDV